MNWLIIMVFMNCVLCGTSFAAQSQPDGESGGDVFNSMQWPDLKKQYLGQGKVVFDERIKVTGPRFAEDPMNVPIAIDATALQAKIGDIQRIVVLVDRNPIRKVLGFEPQKVRATLSFRFKLEQSSPVRAAALMRDGVWHVGGVWVDAAGGGCTVPGASRADGSWNRTLNTVQAKMFPALLSDSVGRLRLRIMHPMDTGLVAGIPAFYIEQLRLLDSTGVTWFNLQTFEPVSENPIFSFDLIERPQQPLRLSGHDNNGNRVAAEIAP